MYLDQIKTHTFASIIPISSLAGRTVVWQLLVVNCNTSLEWTNEKQKQRNNEITKIRRSRNCSLQKYGRYNSLLRLWAMLHGRRIALRRDISLNIRLDLGDNR